MGTTEVLVAENDMDMSYKDQIVRAFEGHKTRGLWMSHRLTTEVHQEMVNM